MEMLGLRTLFSPLVPSPALGPALSQCCIRALGGARTRSASPSSPFWRREPPPPPTPGLLSALLFVARPSAGGSAARVRCGLRPRGPSGRGGTASFPPRSRLACHAAGGGGSGSGPRARLTAGGRGLGSGPTVLRTGPGAYPA